MAYDEFLAERIRKAFHEKNIPFSEKKMMGGLAFMVNEKMCAGVMQNNLMARIDPEIYQDVMQRKGCRPMDFTGKPLKGFVWVKPEGIDGEAELEYWLQLCLDYNPRAKASKKKAAK